MDYQNMRKNIEILQDKLLEALVYLEKIEREIQVVGEDMYPSVPLEQWQDRNGKGRYLYMLFRRDSRAGGYRGPGGKRKIYIGNDSEKICLARRRAENSRRYLRLTVCADLLSSWLRDRTWNGPYPQVSG